MRDDLARRRAQLSERARRFEAFDHYRRMFVEERRLALLYACVRRRDAFRNVLIYASARYA